ncbi:uncharacterized protein LOC136041900 [Artemia franciscana]|uniref:Uncharacterized protein n=1 Tax=Artemia franciscana TaxID=6661 RepID=A0AA88L0Q0_ARTSF|nr:hypothetical protein QYM36_018167 [Artemia franciscana]
MVARKILVQGLIFQKVLISLSIAFNGNQQTSYYPTPRVVEEFDYRLTGVRSTYLDDIRDSRLIGERPTYPERYYPPCSISPELCNRLHEKPNRYRNRFQSYINYARDRPYGQQNTQVTEHASETTNTSISERSTGNDASISKERDSLYSSSLLENLLSGGKIKKESKNRIELGATNSTQLSESAKKLLEFGSIPASVPITTSDVANLSDRLTSTGVPVSPALTVLQELKSLDIGNDSFIDTDESEETVDSEEDGFTVGDPGDFLSSIRFRPVKFRPFHVLEIYDHPIQAYPRLAKPVRADSIISLLKNNFAEVVEELQNEDTETGL